MLTPADFHHLSPLAGDGLELINVIFSEDMLDDELRFLLFSEAPHLGHRYAPEDGAAADFAAMWNEANDTRPGKRKMLENLLERILLRHARACRGSASLERTKDSQVLPLSIRRAVLYMEHHFREDLELEAVAKQAALAPNYFSGLFKKDGRPLVPGLLAAIAHSLREIAAPRFGIVDYRDLLRIGI
ncbi:hypothetical protein [Cohnella rhizosphaerae]|uniref:HTH araC/xylS-type domain-containing protein n=1 Tax=Cohnella rhizosphaerae TaxID=1457232 RepID=A0A9X4KT36_9BACL|nr:hypothetical protein [Cohnella rhizosphaerae]MDG0810480.1 hypothetical protein [Cohnella rhizosphaerae]